MSFYAILVCINDCQYSRVPVFDTVVFVYMSSYMRAFCKQCILCLFRDALLLHSIKNEKQLRLIVLPWAPGYSLAPQRFIEPTTTVINITIHITWASPGYIHLQIHGNLLIYLFINICCSCDIIGYVLISVFRMTVM